MSGGSGRAAAPQGRVAEAEVVRDGDGEGERAAARLPVAVSTLVGRDRERVEVAELLGSRRQVTLTGAGGCGKTRLALEVAGDVAEGFANGALWVELAGVGEPGMVAAVVADAVGVREQPGRDLADVLVEQLRVRHLLVVVDNCEHLVEACAALVTALLRSCPQMSVLATSRTPLTVEGETTWEVPPLSVPGALARTVHEVGSAEAARLFTVRARQVRPDFVVSDDDAAAVAEICRRLDGIPLAVELAAARVRVLSPAQIAAGLSDRFRLLTGGVRESAVRQQTLQASVAWSFELLSDPERLALTRLSVFSGTFGLEAVQAVAAGEGITAIEVLDLVSALASWSLLQVSERDGRARYRLLETIRLFAGDRLAELDDPTRVRDRHLDHYCELAERAEVGLAGPDAEAWVARLAADLDDLRAAMAWAVTSGSALAVLDIAEPTQRFWFERGRYPEMQRRLHAAIDTPAATDDDRARGWGAATLLALGSGHIASAHGLASQVVALAVALEAEDLHAQGLAHRAFAGLLSGRSSGETSRRELDEAVAVGDRLADDAVRSYVLSFAGVAAHHGRTLGEGRDLLERVVAIDEDAGIAFHLPAAHTVLGGWAAFTGDIDRCRIHARKGVALARQLYRPGWECAALSALALADLLQGKTRAACEQFADAEALLRTRGLSPSLFEMSVGRFFGLAAYAAHEPAAARERITGTVRTARERGSRFHEAWGVWLLGELAASEDQHEEARELLDRCRSLATDPRYPFLLGRSLIGLANLTEADEDAQGAWARAHDGLQVLADFGDRVGVAEALETVAGAATILERPEQGLRLLAATERFHDETGVVRFPVAADRYARHLRRARAALDRDEAERCWAAGQGLSLDEAVAYARRGRGERGRPQTGWASLTSAERQLVQLVAEGLTNAQIGEQRFISVNTVKKHLSHVYAKLDVDGRADLAAQAARRSG